MCFDLSSGFEGPIQRFAFDFLLFGFLRCYLLVTLRTYSTHSHLGQETVYRTSSKYTKKSKTKEAEEEDSQGNKDTERLLQTPMCEPRAGCLL